MNEAGSQRMISGRSLKLMAGAVSVLGAGSPGIAGCGLFFKRFVPVNFLWAGLNVQLPENRGNLFGALRGCGPSRGHCKGGWRGDACAH